MRSLKHGQTNPTIEESSLENKALNLISGKKPKYKINIKKLRKFRHFTSNDLIVYEQKDGSGHVTLNGFFILKVELDFVGAKSWIEIK